MVLVPQNKDETPFGADLETLTQECRQLREGVFIDLPTPDEVIDFLEGYNAFINHAQRTFSPIRESNMLL